MNLRTSHILYGYWNEVRGERMAPCRFEIEPSCISEILSETFILERLDARTFPFRLAGTRICDNFGVELRGRNFLELVPDDDRPVLESMLSSVTDQGAVAVCEIEARDDGGRSVAFEVIVLPLTHEGASIRRYLGAVTAIDPPVWLGYQRLWPSGLLRHNLMWPDGRPHAVIERSNRQSPFISSLANARVVRQNRRQFRILEGGRKDGRRCGRPD
jgi:hypothetical protein